MFGIEYCSICKDDVKRMELGYNPHGEDCGRWQCHLLDIFHGIILVILMIPLLIVVGIAALIFWAGRVIFGDGNAVQRQTNAKSIPKRLGRKKSR